MFLGICCFHRLRSFSEPACSLWAKQKAGDDAGPPCKTPQNSFDSLWPLPVLPFKCCSAVELGTSNQKSQVSLFQPLQPQKGERTETCRLPPGFGETSTGSPCPDWPNHRYPQEIYLLFPNFPSLLQCAVLTLLSAPYIIYCIHLFCHLIFACELSFS